MAPRSRLPARGAQRKLPVPPITRARIASITELERAREGRPTSEALGIPAGAPPHNRSAGAPPHKRSVGWGTDGIRKPCSAGSQATSVRPPPRPSERDGAPVRSCRGHAELSRTRKFPARFAGATPVAPGGGVSRNPGEPMCLERKPQRNDLRTMRFVAGSLRTRCRREDWYRNAPSLQSSVECVDAASYQQKNVSQQRFVVSSRWDLSFERTTSPGFRLTPPPGATDVTPAMRAGNLRGFAPLHCAG